MVSGFWFGSIGGDIPGDKLVKLHLIEISDSYLIFETFP
jgi:hypothetical protein